jgi:hypothetical protein
MPMACSWSSNRVAEVKERLGRSGVEFERHAKRLSLPRHNTQNSSVFPRDRGPVRLAVVDKDI